MSEIINPLGSDSYTNKDFQSIYVELLNAAKMLAKNWDPTISNESDPGVVLLKLNAIIADKNNYNIDKNILENYPDTYTQEISARSQYKQLGYKMPWYKAATTRIGFKWVGEKFTDGDSLIIPKHTMLMDAAGNYVFTILEDAVLGKIQQRATSSTEVPAIQGTINTLKLAGSNIISLSNLDSKNRLFINDKCIAENGIYVTSAEDNNNVLWKQVDNVELEPYGTKCYEFDIDPKRNTPYLQFPEDMRNQIGSGIIVKYIVTNGYDGNVSAKTIDTFYDQGTVELIKNTSEVIAIPLTGENFLIYNLEGTVNGQNPEEIESANRSFKRQVCTFDTLITLRDYINAIYTFGKEENALSNVIVTDRTNDIQSHYRIIDKDDGLLGYVDHLSYTPVTKLIDVNIAENVEYGKDRIFTYNDDEYKLDSTIMQPPTEGTAYVERSENIYDMNAFDLKFYVLKNGGLLNTLDAYSSTFTIDNSEETKTAILAHIGDLKAVQHDVVDIKKYVPFMLQNVYPINLKLVPTFKLNDVAKNEVINNIKSTLVNLLNSRNCDFGAEPSYDIIYNAICECDERIKVLILDDFKYTTFAMYLGYSDNDVSGELEFKYVPISDYSTCSRLIVRDSNSCGCEGCANTLPQITTDMITKLNEIDIYKDEVINDLRANTIINKMSQSTVDSLIDQLIACTSDSNLTTELKINEANKTCVKALIKYRLQEAANKILGNTSDSEKFVSPTDKQINSYRFIDSVNGIMYRWPKKLTGINKPENYDPCAIELYSDRLLDIRSEVIARNILSGVTPLFDVPTSTFNLALNMNQVPGLTAAVSDISTSLEVAPFGFDTEYSDEEKRAASYKLRANESLRFLAPSFISDRTYANYVKYEVVLRNPVLSNSEFSWADPADEAELFKTYGTTHFYVQTADNVYTPLFGSRYEPLKDIPNFKLHYYQGVRRGYTNLSKEIITNSNHFEDLYNTAGSLVNNIKTYTPDYEANMYYKIGTLPSKDPANHYFNVISSYYPDFHNDILSSTSHIYRLKHYVHGLVEINEQTATFVPNRYYIYDDTLNPVLLSSMCNCSEQFMYDCIVNKVGSPYDLYFREQSATTTPARVESVYSLDTSTNDYFLHKYAGTTTYLNDYFNQLILSNSDRVIEAEDKIFIKLTADEANAIKYVYEAFDLNGIKLYEYSNIVDYSNCSEYDTFISSSELNPRFEEVKKYSSNAYIKMFKNGTLVGYKVIESDDIDDFKTETGLTDLIQQAYDQIVEDLSIPAQNRLTVSQLIENKHVVLATTPSTWESKYKNTYFVKYLNSNSGSDTTAQYSMPSAPPDYTYLHCFEQLKAGTSNTIEYKLIDRDSTLVDLWDTKYKEAYGKFDYNGLHTSSPEYLKWKNGSLALFVRKASYKIEADTEYQLREGDYVIFFWRSTDEDDAPYTYRKYEWIYDQETGQKTIIKPNFPIHASTYGNRLFNHDSLNPSGNIPYSNDKNSHFQQIFKKMYDQYDLSGSRQIEIRRMNSVKLDPLDKKYYYFICPEIETKTDDQTKVSTNIFSMTFTYAKSWVDSHGTTQHRYHHILQPDEYFIYMNSDQTLYEILGEGTLIEYNTSNTSIPTGKGSQVTFEVTAIDSNEILYRGVDAFREYCKTVENSEIFNLIEQQIYSFVKDDVIQISLKDNVGYTFINVNDSDEYDQSDATHYLDFQYSLVSLIDDNGIDTIEPFVDGEYYQLKQDKNAPGNEAYPYDSTNYNTAPFEEFIKVVQKPDMWDNLKDWYSTNPDTGSRGANYNKYYKLLYSEFIPKSSIPSTELGSKLATRWYKRINPEYPIFKTDEPLLVRNFNVSYSASNGNNNNDNNQLDLTYTTLPNIDVDDDSYGWNVTAHLNVMCDNQKPQKIEVGSDNNQAIQRITVSGNSFPDKFFSELTAEEKETVISEYPELTFEDSQAFIKEDDKYKPAVVGEDEIYILSSIPLDKVGSSFVDVTYIDLLGERHDTQIFTYNLNSACVNADEGWQVVDDGITLRVPAGISVDKTIDGITLDQQYKYLLPFSVQNEKLEFTLESNGQPVKCVCCNSDHFGGTAHSGKHFVEITPGMNNLRIQATNNDNTNDIHILFELLFKYKYRDIFGGDVISTDSQGNQELECIPKYQVTTKDLLEKIREIDIGGKFKYTHVPSIDVEIKDPLDPVSMYNDNHVYNQFTIARAELDGAAPYDATYDIVNNR